MDLVDLAWSQARAGMSRATEHAESDSPGWGDVAYHFLRNYASRNRGKQFTALEVREAAREWGLLEPPSPKAFGAIFVRAQRAGIIVKAGYAPHAERHASPTVLWEAV